MKKGLVISLVLTLTVLFGGMFFVSAAPKPGTCPIQSDTNIVIYGDTGTGGVGSLSKSWITHFMDWWKTQDANVKYVFLNRNDVKTDCNLANFPNVKLYIQPGGNAYYQQKTLGISGKNNILNYIDNGKAYLGICAGAFYAANDYYWRGSYYNWPHLLKRFPTFEGSITNIADYDVNPGYALTEINSADRNFNMIYYGGPTRGWKDTPLTFPGEQKLTFTSIPGNLPASIKNGKMLLMSTHAEAFENDGISGLTTAQRLENYKWLANSINDVAGTMFYVPAYVTPVTQCSDGIDNDLDGLVDFPYDAGCISISDDDEYNFPINSTNETRVNIFTDGFEQGLGAWTLTGIDRNWYITNESSFEGILHAEAQPMNTNEPASIMEKEVSTVGYSNIEFSYYRQLTGLDIADEFKAKWFDGTIWNVLEQTPDSVDDFRYIYKTFSLPTNAENNANFKIKFECTAGAVSEFCRVDNMRVSGI